MSRMTALEEWFEHYLGSPEHPWNAIEEGCGICGNYPDGTFRVCGEGAALRDASLIEQGRIKGIESGLMLGRDLLVAEGMRA